MTSREPWVDYAKAIGILLVVYGHIARGLFDAGIVLSEPIHLIVDSIIYSFHMPLFFFLSGLFYLQSLSQKGKKRLIFSKIDTIAYPFLLWSIIQGSIEALLSNYTNGNVTFTEVFSLLWAPRAQFWFLYVLFLMFVISIMLSRPPHNRTIFILLITFSFLYSIQSLFSNYIIIRLIIDNFVFFLFGALFNSKNLISFLRNRTALLLIPPSFFISQYYFHITMDSNYSQKGGATLLLSFIAISFIIILSDQLSKFQNRLIMFIGASSMAIYLLHILSGSGTRVLLTTLLGVTNPVIHLIAGCIIGVVFPVLIIKLVSRLKLKFVFSAPISNILSSNRNN